MMTNPIIVQERYHLPLKGRNLLGLVVGARGTLIDTRGSVLTYNPGAIDFASRVSQYFDKRVVCDSETDDILDCDLLDLGQFFPRDNRVGGDKKGKSVPAWKKAAKLLDLPPERIVAVEGIWEYALGALVAGYNMVIIPRPRAPVTRQLGRYSAALSTMSQSIRLRPEGDIVWVKSLNAIGIPPG